jgi:non-specific serine/threonine protein kinase/serine/threonine-protein kinase
MTSDRSRRVEELFERASDLPDEAREAFLSEHGGDDPAVLDEVRSLLAHRDDDFLENPDHVLPRGPVQREPDDPERVGPYRILGVLGRGGMGVVYLADQEQPVRRQVALKLIKVGMDTRQVVARFESERQTLAMMNHPNIAHVYDAGATEQGRPYFVMEYVEGEPITRYCDRERLSTRQRLELFTDVCEGLQHAHQKGIIHRDIKASNVLITEKDGHPIPKIIDFGIAKATDHHQSEATAFTELGRIVGTPEYMSPEQTEWDRQDIDTRTDVYSLGVLLYELLVGRLPFDASEEGGGGLEGLRQRIREVDPPRPSARISGLGATSETVARVRSTDPAILVRQLRGDLDWIIMKALAKDREHRYATASELAADIDRYIADEPVIARPPGTAYRVRKFVRRHRVGVVAATVVVLALIAGIAGATVGMVRARRAEALAREEAARANREANAASELADFLVEVFEIPDPDRSRGETITAREILDAGAQRIREEFDGQPHLQGRLMGVMGKVYLGLGLYDEARPLLEGSLDLKREVLGNEHLAVVDALNEIANLAVKNQEYAAAVPYYEAALEITETLPDPGHAVLDRVLKNLGDVHAKLGNFDRARGYHERAIEIRKEWFGAESIEVGRSLSGLGDTLVRSGDPDSAIPLLEESLAIREKNRKSANDPTLGYGRYFLGNALLEADRPEEAIPHLEEALRIWEVALGPGHEQVGTCALRLGEAFEAATDTARADRLYRRALSIDEAAFGADHPLVAETLEDYAGFLRRSDRDAEAAELEARAAAIRARSDP